MKRLFLGFLCLAGAFGAYVYGPFGEAAEADASGQSATRPGAAPGNGGGAAQGPQAESSPGSPLLQLDASDNPLRDVHSVQAELQALKEGARAVAIREMLDRVAHQARREGTMVLQEDPVQAWRKLSLAFFATTDARVRADLRPVLDGLSGDLILSKRHIEGLSQLATIPAGGTLTRIAKDHDTGWRIIARANGINDPKRIRAGDRLKVPHCEVEVHIRKRSFLMLVTYDGGYLRAYEVGTGKFDRTPEAEFSIVEKEIEPTWYGPDGGVYPFGHEQNILGTRWLGFNRDEFSGFGIHGTRFPETIGTESSAGCIRMRNDDVEELFDLLDYNARISITK